jgi:hypothetical protein
MEVVWSISGDLKLELSSTWTRYDAAPLTLPQSRVGVLSSVVLPFEGETRLGTPGVERTVTLQTDDHELSPQALDARTRQ